MLKRTHALVLLVGEQPAPNLLPTRRIKPDKAVLVHTEKTQEIAQNLKALLQDTCTCFLCQVHPYEITEIVNQLGAFLDRELPHAALTFNLTGGTKPMALAAFLMASQRRASLVYFQTEGGRSLLYHYGFSASGKLQLQGQESLEGTVSLDEYLRMYVGDYTTEPPRNEFEQQIHQALRRAIPELEVFSSVRPQRSGALEVDFVVRLRDRVGVIEAKTKAAKSGIDQVQAVAEQRYLGTYVAKFLISGKAVNRNNQNLASAYGITVIELESYGKTGTISNEDCQKLTETIIAQLGKR